MYAPGVAANKPNGEEAGAPADSESAKITSAARLKLKAFLEASPLYTPVRPEVDVAVPEAIERKCRCSSHPATTWKLRFVFGLDETKTDRSVFRVETSARLRSGEWLYTCANCENQEVMFRVQVKRKPLIVRKVGQWPAPSNDAPPSIKMALDEPALGLYEKGLMCLNFGFGVGAFAYFRRVVEETVDDMLDLLVQSAPDDQELRAKVEEARKATAASQRLELVKDAVPRNC